MHYGSSEEKDKGKDKDKGEAENKAHNEEDGPQDRGGEEVDCEEDGYGSSQKEDDRQKDNCQKDDHKKIDWQWRGARPRAFFISHLKQ